MEGVARSIGDWLAQPWVTGLAGVVAVLIAAASLLVLVHLTRATESASKARHSESVRLETIAEERELLAVLRSDADPLLLEATYQSLMKSSGDTTRELAQRAFWLHPQSPWPNGDEIASMPARTLELFVDSMDSKVPNYKSHTTRDALQFAISCASCGFDQEADTVIEWAIVESASRRDLPRQTLFALLNARPEPGTLRTVLFSAERLRASSSPGPHEIMHTTASWMLDRVRRLSLGHEAIGDPGAIKETADYFTHGTGRSLATTYMDAWANIAAGHLGAEMWSLTDKDATVWGDEAIAFTVCALGFASASQDHCSMRVLQWLSSKRTAIATLGGQNSGDLSAFVALGRERYASNMPEDWATYPF